MESHCNCFDAVIWLQNCLSEVNEPMRECVNIEAADDSAAMDVVVPRDSTPDIKERNSKRSSEGRHYVGPDDTMIMNHGAKGPDFFTHGSRTKKVVARVAVVGRETYIWPNI